MAFKGNPRITASFSGYPNSPSMRIESCFYFEASAIKIFVYYAKPGPTIVEQGAERIPELYRLLNLINSSVFIKNIDGVRNELYSPSYLLQPRFYLTEDGCNDITASIVMEEDMFWVAPLEFMDFVTAGLPMLMDQLSPYIYGVLTGKLEVDMAINYIKRYILGEKYNEG